jgi:hypothetical protein
LNCGIETNPLSIKSCPMQRLVLLLFLLPVFSLRAQVNEYFSSPGFKFGGGYTHDFPGLNGHTFFGEYVQPMTNKLQGGLGLKRVNLGGHPRSKSAYEYTKATTIDFVLYFLPVNMEHHIFRIGGGYIFSFYKTRRSYLKYVTEGDHRMATWPLQDSKGSISGFCLVGEYEYLIPQSKFSVGLRASLFKAYDQVTYAGPFVGLKL